jgi:PPOX class probable F420-dependent enzyme
LFRATGFRWFDRAAIIAPPAPYFFHRGEAMSSKTTATKENALSKQEIDERLGATALARMATYRPDGMIHLTPIWYHWNGEVFRLTLGAGRIHLKNLAADKRVSILIDDDPRVEQGIGAGAWAIMCRGNAELSQDEGRIREVTHAVLGMALGKEDADSYTEPVMAEGRTIVTITPQDWLTWDYNKGGD